MKIIKIYKSFLFVLILFMVAAYAQGQSDIDKTRESQVKAAFVYNFIQFVDWSAEKMPANDEPIVIGVINAGEQIKAFDKVKTKQAKGKNIVVKQFEGLDRFIEYSKDEQDDIIEEMKNSHILCFFGLSQENTKLLLDKLSGANVLTIGDSSGFLECQGNIDFLIYEGKVRFEINLISAKANGLKISSKLLKLAKRVVVSEDDEN